MQFRYVGDEYTEAFGLGWKPGDVHNVADEHAIRKLDHNHLFARVGDEAPRAERARGRPAKVKTDVDQNDG